MLAGFAIFAGFAMLGKLAALAPLTLRLGTAQRLEVYN